MQIPHKSAATIPLLALLLLGGLTTDGSRAPAHTLLEALEAFMDSPEVPSLERTVRLFSLWAVQGTAALRSALPELAAGPVWLYRAGPPAQPSAIHLTSMAISRECLSRELIHHRFPDALPVFERQTDPSAEAPLQLKRSHASVVFDFAGSCLRSVDVLSRADSPI